MDYGHQQTDEELKKLERKLAREYKKAKADVERRAREHLKRFEKTDAKLAKMVKDGTIKKKDYLEWREKAMIRTQAWRDLRDTLAADLVHTNEIAIGMINEHAIDCYALNMNYGTYEVESGARIDTSFSIYDHATVENLMKEDPQIIPKAGDDVPKDLRWNRQKLTSAITQGILTGDSIPKIAKRLASVADMDSRAALRNARTYTTAAENKGRVDSYERAKDLGIEMEQEWMSTPDGRTRDSHVDLDGERVPVGGTFSNGCRYPGDPAGDPAEVYNCRCTLVAALKNHKYDPTRFTRLPEGVTYDDWKRAARERLEKKGLRKIAETVAPVRSFAERVNEILDRAYASSEGVTTEVIQEVGRIFAGDVQTEYLDELGRLNESKKSAEARYHELYIEYLDMLEKRTDLKWAYENADALTEGDLEVLGFPTKEALKEHYNELSKNIGVFRKSPEYLDAVTNMNAAREAYQEMSNTEKIGEYMKQKIGEIREVGINGLNVKAHLSNSRSPVRPVIENAYDHYPTAWIKRSIAAGNLSVKKVDRGYYWHGGKEIAISGSGKSSQHEVAIHELGHRFEYTVPGIMELEKEFYEKRTAGESLEWLGSGYARDEKTRKDDFLNPYMGKDYGGDGYELVSMGFQYAYTDPERLAKDPDMQSWIYGMLLAQ